MTTAQPGPGTGSPPRGTRLPVLVALLVVVVVVGIGIVGGRFASGLTPTASVPASEVVKPSLASMPPPWPSDAAVTYDAVFTGDATGDKDVTAALKKFLESHDGLHVALAVDGVYKVTQVSFSAKDLTVDFRGARIKGTLQGAFGIFKIQSSSNIVINDASIEGTGYVWAGGDSNPDQFEHAIEVDGGSDITINNPTTRNTRGDGIYVGYEAPKTKPSTGVVINNPNIERASRNGISPVAGEVTIRGGHIAHTGLFGVDFEPNNDVGATSIKGVVDGVDIRNFGDLPAANASCTCYAVAAAGYSTATKPSMTVQNLTGDLLRVTIRDTTNVVFQNNVSDAATTADFQRCASVTFTGNVRVTRE